MLSSKEEEIEKFLTEFQLSSTTHQAERMLSSWELVSLEKSPNLNNTYPNRNMKNQALRYSSEELDEMKLILLSTKILLIQTIDQILI